MSSQISNAQDVTLFPQNFEVDVPIASQLSFQSSCILPVFLVSCYFGTAFMLITRCSDGLIVCTDRGGSIVRIAQHGVCSF